MDTLTSLLLYLLAFLFLAYVLVFGAGSTGIIGTLHYGLTDGLLLVCDKIGPWILTRRGYTAIRLQCGNLFDKPTPVFQLFYLSLILGGLFIYFAHLHHKIPFHQMSPWHSFWIPTVIISCFVTFGLASFTDPGVVTPENLRQLHTMFPVDGNLYQKKYCDTCGLDRPARSKHCRVCNRCVSRFDHHCIWINSCVGMKNLRWFLSFLWMHVVICAYGAYLIGQYVHWYISSRQLWNANFISSGKQIPASYSILFQYMMLYEAWAVILTIFLFVIAVLLFCFFAHNMWLLAHNWTTNETIRFDTIDENFNSAQYQYYIRQWSEHQSNNNKDNDTNNDNDNDNDSTRVESIDNNNSSSNNNNNSANNASATTATANVEEISVVPWELNPLRGLDAQGMVELREFANGKMRRIYHTTWWRNIAQGFFPELQLKKEGSWFGSWFAKFRSTGQQKGAKHSGTTASKKKIR